jgi:hypothetical protein
MLKKLLGLVVFILLGASSESWAQRLADLPPSTRVRLRLPDSLRQSPLSPRTRFFVGQFVRATPDSIYLQVHGSAPFGIARDGVRMWTSRGASRGRSALWAGAYLGLLGAYTQLIDGERSEALVVGGIGLGVGVVVGALSPWERWRRLRDP